MVQFTILGGGYTGYITSYLFNAVTLSLTLQGRFPSGNNPSWIATNLRRDVLYAVNENPTGAVQSFSININGALSGPTDTVGTGGNGPAFCAQLSNGKVAAVNFGSGDGSFTSTSSDGTLVQQPTSYITFPKPSYPPPKNVSNPHMVLEHNNEVFVPDLGGDTVWRLKEREDGSGYEIQGSIPQPKGSGPRHIAIYDDYLFILHETSSELSVQSIPYSPDGTSITYDSVSIIPPNQPSEAKFAAAEILIPSPCPKFPIPFIYVSNRNIGKPTTNGDSIGIFQLVKNGQDVKLVLINHVFTGLDQIRGMEFGNLDNGGEEYLIAGAASGSGGVAIFQRTDEGRDLKLLVRNKVEPNQTSFAWL